MEATEVIYAYGHENVRSTHTTTFEITKETSVTKRGNCIIAIGATKGAADLHAEFKDAARNEDAQITLRVEAGRITDVVNAQGTHRLLFTHPTDVVMRKSTHDCDRTVAIRADKAANDFPRRLVEKLRTPRQRIKITLTVWSH